MRHSNWLISSYRVFLLVYNSCRVCLLSMLSHYCFIKLLGYIPYIFLFIQACLLAACLYEALRSSDLRYLTSIFNLQCQKYISSTFLSVSELSLLLGKSLFKKHYVPQHLKQANTRFFLIRTKLRKRFSDILGSEEESHYVYIKVYAQR